MKSCAKCEARVGSSPIARELCHGSSWRGVASMVTGYGLFGLFRVMGCCVIKGFMLVAWQWIMDNNFHGVTAWQSLLKHTGLCQPTQRCDKGSISQVACSCSIQSLNKLPARTQGQLIIIIYRLSFVKVDHYHGLLIYYDIEYQFYES